MAINERVLNQVIQSLDISPSDFRLAQGRYSAVSDYLSRADYSIGDNPETYLQGSFRLGTVIRPYRNGADSDFDIDQVIELKNHADQITPDNLKNDIGDHLKDSGVYEPMLDEEGKRCWTLQYASENARPGFHLDILPSIPNRGSTNNKIDITNKDEDSGQYTWSSSNPKDYYYWFKRINSYSSEFESQERGRLFEENRELYEALDDIPKQLFRSSLQKSIQLLKRHRDVFFSNNENKPISIIITTICSHLYDGSNITDIINTFIDYVISRHVEKLGSQPWKYDGVLDFDGINWQIINPVDEEENFADKWIQNKELEKAFFHWVYKLRREFDAYLYSGHSNDLSLETANKGNERPYPNLLVGMLNEREANSQKYTNNLLTLINLAIDKKVDWDVVENLGWREYEIEPQGESKDVALVNFYQILLHRGRRLGEKELTNIKNMLRIYIGRPEFILCCNILLGTATKEMLRDCINNCMYSPPITTWPILRLMPGIFI